MAQVMMEILNTLDIRLVINPNGDILVELNREEATISVDINIQEVSRQRDAIPIFRNLKPHLYK